MQELWFLCSACHLMLIDIYMKFREDSLKVSSYRADRSGTDRQTDRQTADAHGKNNMCPNPKGGGGVGGGEDIIHRYIFAEKMWVAFANAKATHLLSAKIIAYMPYLMIKVLMIH